MVLCSVRAKSNLFFLFFFAFDEVDEDNSAAVAGAAAAGSNGAGCGGAGSGGAGVGGQDGAAIVAGGDAKDEFRFRLLVLVEVKAVKNHEIKKQS